MNTPIELKLDGITVGKILSFGYETSGIYMKKIITILRKVYHHTNTDYEKRYCGKIGYKTDFLTETQYSLLEKHDLVPNNFQERTHDMLVKEFLKLKNSNKLDLEFSSSLFIKGLSGDYPRYRQTLMSYWYINQIKEHKFKDSENTPCCMICGLPQKTTQDRTRNLFTYYLGHSWNESPEDFLDEINDILNYPKPIVNEKDKEFLIKLLKEINKADPEETPGSLEKRIAKLKLLPKTDKYKRYGILQTLAVIGVLPHKPEIANSQPTRSDIVLPLAGWRGELGVNFDKVFEIFNIRIN